MTKITINSNYPIDISIQKLKRSTDSIISIGGNKTVFGFFVGSFVVLKKKVTSASVMLPVRVHFRGSFHKSEKGTILIGKIGLNPFLYLFIFNFYVLTLLIPFGITSHLIKAIFVEYQKISILEISAFSMVVMLIILFVYVITRQHFRLAKSDTEYLKNFIENRLDSKKQPIRE